MALKQPIDDGGPAFPNARAIPMALPAPNTRACSCATISRGWRCRHCLSAPANA